MKILKLFSITAFLCIPMSTGAVLAEHVPSVVKTVNLQQEGTNNLHLIHRRYYRYPYYHPRRYRYWRPRPYYYRPYYYGYPRHGYIGPNYYGYYPYPYYRRWYGPRFHLHYGW